MSKEAVDAIVARVRAETALITSKWQPAWQVCSHCPVLVLAKTADEATEISHHDQSKGGGLWMYAVGASNVEDNTSL